MDLLLPEGTRLIHIGPQKTGTSALQQALQDALPALEAAGVVRLGRGRHESMAVSHLIGRAGLGTPVQRARRWKRLKAQVDALAAERAVLSSEVFAEAGPEGIAQTVAALGPNLHIVVTLRPLAKILPSQWQQFLVVRLDLPYEEWLDVVLSPDNADHPEALRFWHRHRHDALVARWAAAVGAENLTVIALDPRRRSMMGETIEAMLGLPAETLTVDRVGNAGDNRSFTYAEAEMVRRFNELAKRDENAALLRTRGPTRSGFAFPLRSRTPDTNEAQITTPAWALQRAGEIGAEMAENLRASGVRIVGDLEEIASSDGPTGEPQGKRWLPPEVGARFAVAIHHAHAEFERTAAPAQHELEPVVDPLATASARALARELRRRVRRRLQ